MKNNIKSLFFSFFLIFFSISCWFFDNYQQQPVYASSEIVEYKGDVEHVFTHCLLAYPALALSKNNDMRNDYLRDCITKDEFSKIISSLYEKNYILINPNILFEKKDGIIYKNKLFLPKGKKPLVFSFDDVNYDRKKIGKGMVDKIVIKDGKLASQTIIDGKCDFSFTNEFIPLLEAFCEKHPDFSWKGAKGMLCLTGYDGILGYRTQKSHVNHLSEIESVKPIVNKLIQNGWTFASHSFGHYHMKKISYEQFIDEIRRWNNEVATIVGDTHIYVYPYGEWEILNNNSISAKHQALVDNGFELFCGVGMQPFFSFFPRNAERSNQILFMDRKPLDGFSLKNRKKELNTLFNCDLVWDFSYRDN